MLRCAPIRFAVALTFALLVITLIASSSAHAIGLGEIASQSSLGAPLRVVIPVAAASGEDLSSRCFRLGSASIGGGGPPQALTAKVSLERGASVLRLVVTTVHAVNEPVARLTVEAGCEKPIRRDYVLLLDPPAADSAVASASANARKPGQDPPAHPAVPARRGERSPLVVADTGPTPEPRAPGQRGAPRPAIAGFERAARAPAQAFAGQSTRGLTAVSAPTSDLPIVPAAKRQQPQPSPAAVNVWGQDWPYAVAFSGIGALLLSAFFVRRRHAAFAQPTWLNGMASTFPNSITDLGAPPVTIPSSDTDSELGTVPANAKTETALTCREPPPETQDLNTLLGEIEADLIEERAVREAWATARSEIEGAPNSEDNSILRAIAAAERDLDLAPPGPAQAVIDRALDEDLLVSPPRR